MKLIVTGGIGCGKSTITSFLRIMLPNYAVFDMDRVVHLCYNDYDIQEELWHVFGTHSRKQISDIVFFDSDEKDKLYRIINPHILRAYKEAHYQPNVIFDVPLYFEHLEPITPKDENLIVICAYSSPTLQLKRIIARDGISKEKAQVIISQQLPLQEKMAKSDWCICTEESRESIYNTLRILVYRNGLLT